MGGRRIKKDANQDIERDEQALHAKKRLQKIQFSSHPLGGRSFAADFDKNGRLPPSWACHHLSTIDYARLPIRSTLRTAAPPFTSFWAHTGIKCHQSYKYRKCR